MYAMKRIVFIVITLLATVPVARAFDFSKPTTAGQTLYYDITSANGVTLVAPNGSNWNGYDTPAGLLTVPTTVEHNGTTYNVVAVANNAFRGCNQLTSIYMPGSVASIGYTAFFSCPALTSVRIAEGMQSIGRMAFANCPLLDTIELPTTLREIGVSAFNSTAFITNTDNWRDSVLYIGPYVIEVSSLVTGPVVIEEGTIGLGSAAFNYCHNLQQVVLPSSLLFVGFLAFSDCAVLDTVRCLATVPPTLADDAFSNIPIPTVVVPCGSLNAYTAAPYWGQLNLVDDCGLSQSIADATMEHPHVATVADGIEVRGAEGRLLTVSDMSGRTVYSTHNAAATQRVTLPTKGIYVVTIDGHQSYKVVSGVK